MSAPSPVVRSRALVSIVLGVVLVLAIGAGASLFAFGQGAAHPVASERGGDVARLGGCRLSRSPDGYPSQYITRPLPYRVHPPLPVSGWHSSSQPLRFDVLFHSLFHGYLVVEYRRDVPMTRLAGVRAWMRRHSHQRIVATPASFAGEPRLDVAEWGWELRCDTTVPSASALDRFAARRGT